MHLNFKDSGEFERQCRHAREMGFDGKTLIHPVQVEAANAAFAPSAEAVAWAERVVAAFAAPEAVGKGAIPLDGAMVERLHLAEAKRVLALVDAGAG